MRRKHYATIVGRKGHKFEDRRFAVRLHTNDRYPWYQELVWMDDISNAALINELQRFKNDILGHRKKINA